MFKKLLLILLISIFIGSGHSFAKNNTQSFSSFMRSNYGLTLSKDFKNVQKYCKTSPLSKKLPILINNCNKNIKTYIQESFNIILSGENIPTDQSKLSEIYTTLNGHLNNKLSTQSNSDVINSVRTDIKNIIKNQKSLTISIDQEIAIKIASLHIILNDYILNNNIIIKKSNAQNCGSDYNCFIEKAKTCAPSILTTEIELDFIGVVSTTTRSHEIKGIKNDKCSLYIKVIKQDLSYSKERINAGISLGLTIDEINQDLKETTGESKEFMDIEIAKGLDGVCNINSTNLIKTVNERSKGVYNNEQLSPIFCSGKLFPKNQIITINNS